MSESGTHTICVVFDPSMSALFLLLFASFIISSINAFAPFLSGKIVTRAGMKMAASDDNIKDYLSHLHLNFDKEDIRFVVQGTGAILEASGRFSNLRYSDTPSKRSELATVSTANDFECHFVLNEIKSIKHVVLDKKEVLHVIRFVNAADQTLVSLIFKKMEGKKWNELTDKYNTVYTL